VIKETKPDRNASQMDKMEKNEIQCKNAWRNSNV